MLMPDWTQLEFPVSLRPIDVILEEDSMPIPRTRAVYREDKGLVLDIVSTRYKLVPHGEIFRPLHALVEQLPHPLAQVRTVTGDHGGYALVEWVLDHEVEVVPGDTVALALLARNSVNRSSALKIELTARRLLCSNGMRGPGPEFVRSWKHFTSLVQGEVLEDLKGLLARAPDMMDRWRSWTQRKLYPQRFETWLQQDSQAKQVIGERAREEIVSRLMRSSSGGTPTVSLWDCYNTLTEHATHHLNIQNPQLLPARQDAVHQVALKFARWISRN